MQERKKKILKAIIKEYQRIGQPVSSQLLTERFHLDFSPATVRAEMMSLDEEGFLEQPHVSAGRVPTDKAWRFFLEEEKDDLSSEEKRCILKRVNKLERELLSIKKVAQFLADCSRSFGVSGIFGRLSDFHEAGFHWLFNDFSFDDSLTEFLKEVDSFEEDFSEFFNYLDEPVQIFIGQENPIKYLRNFSLVVGAFESEIGRGVLGILGSKRMNYKKNKFVVEQVQKKIKGRSCVNKITLK